MKILHYSLGFPPERSGGLIRYTMDLMNEQVKQGDEVYYLYPGHINVLRNRAYIKADRKNSKINFTPYALVNSLPLPLFGGIKNPNDFMRSVDAKLYLNFLEKLQPDVIHVHTLMGIHKEFFECAQSLGIRIVFTSHDYFGLAPEPNFYYQGRNYDNTNTTKQWMEIGQTAMPTWKLRLFQTSLYPFIRKIAHKIKPQKLTGLDKTQKNVNENINETINKNSFELLQQYYKSIFSMISFFHFNSTLALSIYQNNIQIGDNYACISITNSSVKKNDFRIPKKAIKIAYIGPYKTYKGFFEFLKLPTLLQDKNFEFHVYGSDVVVDLPNNIINHGRFNNNELDNIYQNIDFVIVPSLWKETFGFITIEALSYGKYVLVSQNVGAKDLIDPQFRFDTVKDIRAQIDNLDKYKVREQKSMDTHYSEIKNIYLKFLP